MNSPPWQATLGVTVALLAFAAYLVAKSELDGLAGAIVGFVGGYWLPVRPARQPIDRRNDG